MGSDGGPPRGEDRGAHVDAPVPRRPWQAVDGRSVHEPPATLSPVADRALRRTDLDRLGVPDQTVLLGGERFDLTVDGCGHGPDATDWVRHRGSNAIL